MREDPFKKEHNLSKQLDEYHVYVPDFPMKKNRWERFIHFLFSPANNPIEPFISTTNGIIMLKIVPLVGTVVLAIAQVILFI